MTTLTEYSSKKSAGHSHDFHHEDGELSVPALVPYLLFIEKSKTPSTLFNNHHTQFYIKEILHSFIQSM